MTLAIAPLLTALVRGAGSFLGMRAAAGAGRAAAATKPAGKAGLFHRAVKWGVSEQAPSWISRGLNAMDPAGPQERRHPDPLLDRAKSLSPSDMMRMMGQSRRQIADADTAARVQNEKTEADREAEDQTERITGAFKKLAMGASGLVASFFVIPPILRRWTESLVESRRELARYTGTLGGAYARLDITRFQLDVETARDTSGTGRLLVEQFTKLLQESQQLREQGHTLVNLGGTTAAGLARLGVAGAEIVTEMSGVASMLRSIERALDNRPDDERAFGHRFLDILGDPAKHGLPDTDPPPPLPPIE